MKILFLGSSYFSRLVLEKLLKSKHSVCAVITQPDRPSGRGHKLVMTEVKEFALENNIPVYTFEKVNKSMDEVRKIKYDYAITASFGQLLSQEFLDYRPCINVHPSLLPKYRGATPIQTALLNGDEMTGVTIMKVVKAMDAGDILLQRKHEILPEDNTDTLMEKLGKLGGDMAVEAFDLIESGKAKFTPQDEHCATFVKLLNKEDGRLDFNRTAKELVNQFRALGSNPGCYFMVGDKAYKVGGIREEKEIGASIGKIIKSKEWILIACRDHCVQILKLQAPSGKMLNARDFLNGNTFGDDYAG